MRVEQLAQDVADLTGAPPPEILAEDAPVLQPGLDQSLYFVGIIGGKDVGKSSLVNALVGQTITEASSHGPGTKQIVAYAHAQAESRLREQLNRIAPDAFRIVTHRIEALASQVLLDLPDIDSVHGHHLELVRKMLRHMLHPIWVQSVEKYADLQPQRLLAQVAAGNDPSNFLFCLNKIDQLAAHDSASAIDELRDDYAGRVARVLELPQPPRVFMVSATHPAQFDLPHLSALLSKSRQPRQIRAAFERAGQRRDQTLLKWIDWQRLHDQLQRLDRLLHESQELAARRIAQPLMEDVLPRWSEDPAHRAALVEPAIRAHIARWPIVNMLDTLLHPLVALVQRNLSSVGTAPAPLDAYLADEGRSTRSLVQGTFALLQGSHPLISQLYRHQHLWDEPAAEAAVADLRRRLHSTVVRQRQQLAGRLSGSTLAAILAPWRWLLTVGAVLWFPFLQPLVLSAMDAGRWTWSSELARTMISLVSVAHLLQSTIFLLLWFAILWMVLRWMSQRRATRLLARWSRKQRNPYLSLPAQVMLWLDDLLEPIRAEHERHRRVVERVESLRTGRT